MTRRTYLLRLLNHLKPLVPELELAFVHGGFAAHVKLDVVNAGLEAAVDAQKLLQLSSVG
jgi:hypothetical protein